MDNTPNFPPPNFAGGNPFEPNDNAPLDPDNPGWGALAGIGVWFASIVFALIAGFLFGAVWFMVTRTDLPKTAEDIQQLLLNPSFVLYQLGSTLLGHLLTLILCWGVVTGWGKRSFGEAIGWSWHEPVLYKIGLIVGVVILAIAAMIILQKILPESETPFAQLLKLSSSIRYVVAIMAVFTAPIVEELVYRCLLYSPLKRAMGTIGAVTIVTLLFALVHVSQYQGSWGGITAILLLSLALTAVRAKTKSLFPCVAIHTLFNLISAVSIVIGGGS